MIHRNNPKHEIFRFDIQSEMATETEFKTLFETPLGVTKLMLIQRYLYTYWYLYLSQISRRSLQNLYLYYGVYTCSEVPVGTTEILRNVYWYCRTYSYTKVRVSTTCSNVPRDAHLCLYQTYLILIRECP